MDNTHKKTLDITSPQLNLGINLQLDARISDFAGESWTPIIDAVRQLHAGLLERFYIYGTQGAGKSHLLSAICESYIDTGMTAIKLSLTDLVALPTDSLLSLENYNLIALDDMQHVAGHKEWEEALFHLINRSEQGKCQLVFACDVSVYEVALSLKDLASRIAQAPSFKLPDGDLIADRESTLNEILARRQLSLDKRITRYLIHHGPANTGSMVAALNELQRLCEGVRTKRAPTPLVEQARAIVDGYTQRYIASRLDASEEPEDITPKTA